MERDERWEGMMDDAVDMGSGRAPSGWGRLAAAVVLMGVTGGAMLPVAVIALATLVLADPGSVDMSFLGAASGVASPAALSNGTVLLEVVTMAQLVGGGLALLFAALLGGRALVRPRAEGARFTVLTCWPLVTSAVVMLAAEAAYSVLAEGAGIEELFGPPSADWPQNLLLVVVLCLSVGLLEEGAFRGLLLHGLLARMGATRRGAIGAIAVSSLAFGLSHVAGSDLSGALGLPQAALKTLQAGVVGVILAIVVLRTDNLWCAVFVHALFDFLSMAPYAFGDMGEIVRAMSESYVATGDDALVALVVYVVAIALSLPSLVACLRAFGEVPVPNRGAFYVVPKVGTGQAPPPPDGLGSFLGGSPVGP